MTVKAIIRAADWTLGPDVSDGAPDQPLHDVECTTCGESPDCAVGDRLPAEIWALKHTGLKPTHRGYRAVQTTFWRASPAPGNPLYSSEQPLTAPAPPMTPASAATLLGTSTAEAGCSPITSNRESHMSDDGKHAGQPSDKPWTPPPPSPSPDGPPPKATNQQTED
ncbi:hypothetical protein [Streptomyces spiramyceticus]|uniref:DUF7848 domain-containing protein n=1 Tax=Streptomyces spiramyceticus TaxID=299717 RepID=UPI00237A598C|nr:hypothetical protein [Streptomyces spiramyceticus]